MTLQWNRIFGTACCKGNALVAITPHAVVVAVRAFGSRDAGAAKRVGSIDESGENVVLDAFCGVACIVVFG